MVTDLESRAAMKALEMAAARAFVNEFGAEVPGRFRQYALANRTVRDAFLRIARYAEKILADARERPVT